MPTDQVPVLLHAADAITHAGVTTALRSRGEVRFADEDEPAVVLVIAERLNDETKKLLRSVQRGSHIGIVLFAGEGEDAQRLAVAGTRAPRRGCGGRPPRKHSTAQPSSRPEKDTDGVQSPPPGGFWQLTASTIFSPGLKRHACCQWWSRSRKFARPTSSRTPFVPPDWRSRRRVPVSPRGFCMTRSLITKVLLGSERVYGNSVNFVTSDSILASVATRKSVGVPWPGTAATPFPEPLAALSPGGVNPTAFIACSEFCLA